ncbi:hypothetical protein WH47_00351 [Habropoda laboriosa]|uniref:Uncharacterized protein n=1 Tax=Habropoda laboriosa TaxID=597456 RepID=A0A0L7R202_9HYME|nr:hypothetical protein WH47_00351 [Habropoda laboriosa]
MSLTPITNHRGNRAGESNNRCVVPGTTARVEDPRHVAVHRGQSAWCSRKLLQCLGRSGKKKKKRKKTTWTTDEEEEEEEEGRREAWRVSGRVAAGIGSSLEIAAGWLPHRLGGFIRGFRAQSGERYIQWAIHRSKRDYTSDQRGGETLCVPYFRLIFYPCEKLLLFSSRTRASCVCVIRKKKKGFSRMMV